MSSEMGVIYNIGVSVGVSVMNRCYERCNGKVLRCIVPLLIVYRVTYEVLKKK